MMAMRCTIVTVEKVKRFKPAPEVYHHLAETVGKGVVPQKIFQGSTVDSSSQQCNVLTSGRRVAFPTKTLNYRDLI